MRWAGALDTSKQTGWKGGRWRWRRVVRAKRHSRARTVSHFAVGVNDTVGLLGCEILEAGPRAVLCLRHWGLQQTGGRPFRRSFQVGGTIAISRWPNEDRMTKVGLQTSAVLQRVARASNRAGFAAGSGWSGGGGRPGLGAINEVVFPGPSRCSLDDGGR